MCKTFKEKLLTSYNLNFTPNFFQLLRNIILYENTKLLKA